MADKSKSNYEVFKDEALKRFLTFDQGKMIRRLGLSSDEKYIYVPFLQHRYRFYKEKPELECLETTEEHAKWRQADPDEVLTLCDLLCHTEEPVILTGNYTSLQSLNRVKSGTTQTTLGSGMFQRTAETLDHRTEALCRACEMLGGKWAGKGDVAYEILLCEGISVRFSFYNSDEEFPPQVTILLPSDICKFLHYETLYYLTGMLLKRLVKLVEL